MIRGTSGPDESREIPNIVPPQSGQSKKAQNKKSQPLPLQGEDTFVSNEETVQEPANTVANTVEGYEGVIKKLFKLPNKATEFLAQKTFERFNKEENT